MRSVARSDGKSQVNRKESDFGIVKSFGENSKTIKSRIMEMNEGKIQRMKIVKEQKKRMPKVRSSKPTTEKRKGRIKGKKREGEKKKKVVDEGDRERCKVGVTGGFQTDDTSITNVTTRQTCDISSEVWKGK
ncbi:hypothetical protein RUM43_012734 [Polyplax serrata]|uniref:Uncharacterized protein n=1 Tax=Polyplax serrata TaxID=468196 RepID=A0AAN8NYE5_POLSC